MNVNYFNKQGEPISLMEWSDLFEDSEYKMIEQSKIKGYLISTMWTGVNSAIFKEQPILIFETMIFSKNRTVDYQKRYSTLEEAKDGHQIALSFAARL